MNSDDVIWVVVTSSLVLRAVAAEPPAVAVVKLAADLLLQLQMLSVDRGRRPVPSARRVKEADLCVKSDRIRMHTELFMSHVSPLDLHKHRIQ